ncbi:hypothetical protein ILUMI_03433 [Ignelater luminosus]|uniref:Uncharacterized protein n=1 Tax=Ignelater luminosus TaxID=2038154 RepID=A0A8K0DB05_IGNLU|nr:hypothetical protein ILUMI_03433 [Ignelater luminosus]
MTECRCKSSRVTSIRAVFSGDGRYIDILRRYRYPDIIRPTSLPKESNHSVVHHISTRGLPVHWKPRRFAPDKLKAAIQEFQKMLDSGIICLSLSPWASQLHLIPKSDNSWRSRGNYPSLNAVTVPDRYPIPHILMDKTKHSQARQQEILLAGHEKISYYMVTFLHPMPAGEDQPPHEFRTFTAPDVRFSYVHIDIVGSIPSFTDKQYILTLIDRSAEEHLLVDASEPPCDDASGELANCIDVVEAYLGEGIKSRLAHPKESSKEICTSGARRIMENVFASMSAIFRVLEKPMLLEPEKAQKDILACTYIFKQLFKKK